MSSLLSRTCRLSKKTIRWIRPTRGFLTFLIFLVLSGIFWLTAALNEYYDCEVAIPVVVEGVPKSVILTYESGDTVRVNLNDKGYNFIEYLYYENVQPIVIKYSGFSPSAGRSVVSTAELQKLISKRFYKSSKINSIKPERLEFTYAKGVAKTVPVRIDGQVVPAANYYLAHTQLSPEKVTIFAPRRLADSIKYVSTVALHAVNFTDTVKMKVNIRQIKGAKIYPETVDVMFCPDILTEETVEVPITAINVPEGVTLRTFPARAKVNFTVGVSQYRRINTSQFRVVADYNDIAQGSEKCRIYISQMPNEVMKANTEISQVDYLIEN